MGAVTSVAGGVAAGAIGGPPGMIVGGIVGLARHLTSQPHETKEAPALQQAAQAITGIADAAEQVVALEADPVKSEAFRLKALEIRAATQEAERAHLLAMFKAANEDRDAARKADAERTGVLRFATLGFCLLVFALYAAVLVFGMFGHAQPAPDDMATLRTVFVGCIVYWTGSSIGSARKDERKPGVAQ